MKNLHYFLSAIFLSPVSFGAIAADLKVGPDEALKTPSEAAKFARDGDIIEIAAGLYDGDSTIWRQNKLTLRGVGGRAHMKAGTEIAEDKAIWVIKGRDTTVENIEFSNARVDDRNGAGIRQEGPGLIVRNCYFHHNENGILSNSDPNSDIIVEHSEFFANGHGDGLSHNMYIGLIRKFTLRYSYSHGADIGHQVKSRAGKNFILYNRLMDEATGTSSYLIDLPNGGYSAVIGNVLQQSPETDNSTMVAFGAEGSLHKSSVLYMANNTLVNDRHTGIFLKIKPVLNGNVVANNLFAGRGKLIGEANFINNLETTKPEFLSANNYDYRLTENSPAVDAGNNLGKFGPMDLTPTHYYKHPLMAEPRHIHQKLDIGAYEYSPKH